MMRLIVGEAFGLSSPVKTYSPMYYLDVAACEGSLIPRPNYDPDEPENPKRSQECAIYVVEGEVSISGTGFKRGNFLLLDEGESEIKMLQPGRLIILGGEKFDNIPFITWNFVAYSKERINQAVEEWRAQKFPIVPGDDKEFIPF